MLNKQTHLIFKIIPIIIFALIFGLFLIIPLTKTQAQDISIYLNGSQLSLQNKPIIVNNFAMLPLRDMFNIFGCDNVSWDNEQKTVTAISGELELKLNAENILDELNGQSLVLKDGRVYLPIRYISYTFDSYINYADHKIDIITPFMFKDGQWYTSGFSISNNRIGAIDPSIKKPVIVNNETVKKIDDKIYYQLLAYGSPIDSYHFYSLDNNGNFKYVLFMDGTTYNYKIDGDMLYYQYNASAGGWGTSVIEKANLSVEPIKKQIIGQAGFSYGSKIVLKKNDPDYWEYSLIPNNWEMTADGLYAVGYEYSAAMEGRVNNPDFLEKSYGYYLIDLETNTHTLVTKLSLEYK